MNIHDDKLLLDVQALKCYLPTIDGVVKAVDGVDVSLYRGEAFGIAGESGCGKSMLALTIMGLAPAFEKRIIQGKVLFKGKNLLQCSQKELNRIRGSKIAMVFQEPMTSLNPTLSIGTQLIETLIRHEEISAQEATNRAIQLLEMVNIPTGRKMLSQYPHQLSGGMRQRVMIAMALACQPEILIADEPTTALDVTVQAQIMSLIGELQKSIGTSTILITHNLGLIAEFATRIMVMNAIPKLGKRSKTGKTRLEEIKGAVPNPLKAPVGCKFYPRCNYAKSICENEEPHLKKITMKHHVRCWRY
jgi:oligopeptide/dipeptide ABC transporter ATP-binding protein